MMTKGGGFPFTFSDMVGLDSGNKGDNSKGDFEDPIATTTGAGVDVGQAEAPKLDMDLGLSMNA